MSHLRENRPSFFFMLHYIIKLLYNWPLAFPCLHRKCVYTSLLETVAGGTALPGEGLLMSPPPALLSAQIKIRCTGIINVKNNYLEFSTKWVLYALLQIPVFFWLKRHQTLNCILINWILHSKEKLVKPKSYCNWMKC